MSDRGFFTGHPAVHPMPQVVTEIGGDTGRFRRMEMNLPTDLSSQRPFALLVEGIVW